MKRLTFQEAFRKQLQVQEPLTKAQARRIGSPCELSHEPFGEGDVLLYFAMLPPKGDSDRPACLQKAKASVLRRMPCKYSMSENDLIPFLVTREKRQAPRSNLSFKQAFRRQLASGHEATHVPPDQKCFVTGERLGWEDKPLCFLVANYGTGTARHALLKYAKRQALEKKVWKYHLVNADAIPIADTGSFRSDPPLSCNTTMDIGALLEEEKK